MEKNIADVITLNIIDAQQQTREEIKKLKEILNNLDDELSETQNNLIIAEIAALTTRLDILIVRAQEHKSVYYENIKIKANA